MTAADRTDVSLAVSPALRDALVKWLDQCKALDGAADHTLTAYRRDVLGYLAFLARHHGGGQGLAAT